MNLNNSTIPKNVRLLIHRKKICVFHPTRKISPEELERKRQEMMENAKWREEERANNLRKHRREEELERELQKLDSRDGKFFQ